MTEYITKKDAELVLRQFKKGFRRIDEICAVNGCILEIQDMDSVDAAEVVHARWHKPTPCSQEFCTNCRLTPKTNFGWLPPYCPNCGAHMDLEAQL